MSSRIWSTLVVFLGLMILSAASLRADSIRVGVYDNPPKIGIDENGRAVGFFPDLMRLIAEREGWHLNFVPCNWTDCLDAVETGNLDLMMDVAYSANRAAHLRFNKVVVLSNWSRVYTLPDSHIRSILDLDGKRVGVVENSYQARRLAEDAEAYAIKPDLVELAGFSEVFNAVASGFVDAGVVNRLFGARHTNAHDLRETDILLFPSRLHFVAPADRQRLLQRIDHHLRDLRTNRESPYHALLRDLLRDVAHDESQSGIPLTANERRWLADHPVIRVAGDRAWPPIEFTGSDGEFRGMSVDFLQRVSDMLGIRFEFAKDADWNTVVGKLRNKELDMFAAAAETAERRKFAIFTTPHISLSNAIFTRTDAPFIADLGGLVGKKVSVVKGYALAEYAKSTQPNIDFVEVVDVSEGLRQLKSGKVDAHLGAVMPTGYVIRMEGYLNVKVSGVLPYKLNLAMAARSDWPAFAGILQKALDAISAQEREDIRRRWTGLRVESKPDYRLFWRWIAFFAALALLFVVWNFYLQRRNAAQRQQLEAVNRDLLREITERRLAEGRANQANQAKTDFLARMSHDLRTPLNAIKGFSEMMSRDQYGPTNSPREYARIISKSAEFLASMVNDLLDISKIESDEYVIKEEEIDVVAEITESCHRLLYLNEWEKTGQARIDAPSPAPKLFADKRAVSQILDNLLGNAIKYTADEPRITIGWTCDTEGRGVLTVNDNGMGIPEGSLERITQPFVQGNDLSDHKPHISRPHAGIGLGLHIVSRLAQLHQGELTIDSTVGKGTTVTLTFPATRLRPIPGPTA